MQQKNNLSRMFFSFIRPIAIGALITTILACLLVVVQALLDNSEMDGEVILNEFIFKPVQFQTRSISNEFGFKPCQFKTSLVSDNVQKKCELQFRRMS